MGNMSGRVDMGWRKISEGAGLVKLVTLSVAALLSFEASSTVTVVPATPHYDLPVQRYFSPSVSPADLSGSRGFAPASIPPSAPALVYQEQQRWVF